MDEDFYGADLALNVLNKKENILNMTVAEARERGVKKTTLYAIQDKIHEGEAIKWKGTNTLLRLN